MESTKVSWTLGFTMNMGNFESLRLDCQVIDYQRDDETAKEASNRIYQFVENQLIEKLKEAKEELA